ncbi:polysaccharide biosynthesis C-terminal domain-containing protein [Sphingomonas solaris]|nr:polysaccharide biosynthesis C-terminal domain-containing protein [Sphingomonas solaris]
MGVVTSRVAVRAAQFVSTLIMARLLGPAGRGLVSALTVPQQLSVNIAEMGMRQSTAFHLGRDIFPLHRLQPTLLTMVPIASIIAMVLSIGYFEFAHIAEGDWTLRLLAVAPIPLLLCASYASGVFLGRQRIGEFRKTSWRPAFATLLLVVILVGWAGAGVKGALIATVGGGIVSSVYALYLLGSESPLRLGFDREVASRLQRRGLSYAAALVILTLNYRVMILLLARESTLAEVGLYAQAMAIAELVWEIPTVLGSLLLSRGVNARDSLVFSRKVLLLARFSFVAAVLLSVGIGLAAEFLFPLLYGARFANSADICVALLPGIVAFIVFKVLNTDMAGRGKPWASMLIMLPVLVLNVVLGWLLIDRYGAIGAAFASSVGYLVATVGYVLLYSRLTGIPLREMLLPQPGDLTMAVKALPGPAKRIAQRLGAGRER